MRISDCSSDVCSSDRTVSTRSSGQSRSGDNSWYAAAQLRTQTASAGFASQSIGVLTTSRAPSLTQVSRRSAPRMVACPRSEEHTSELQSLMRISYAVFCLKKKKINKSLKQQTLRHM